MRDSALPSPRRVRAAWLLPFAVIALALLPGPAPTAAQDDPNDMQARDRKASMHNLRQIGIALHAFHDKERRLPPPALCSPRGKPLLSWRVAILPWLDQADLHKQFRFNEPWDSPHNKALLKKMPAVYAPVGVKTREPYTTFYQAVVGPGAAWELRPDKNDPFGAAGLRLSDFTDGLSNTILVVEGWDPVPWTKPADVAYDPKKPLPKLGGLLRNGFNVLTGDANVRFLSNRINEKTLRALITRAGGEPIALDKPR
jgi:Protein of unknown function (DUF1559)